MKRSIYILFVLLFACVVVVPVSTYEAQAFFWFFKPKPKPTPKPTPTPADCTEVENQLAACTDNLDTCNSSLSACGADLNTCNADLGQALADLGVCNADLGTCNTDLGQAQSDLAACTSDLDTCTDDLAACEANTGSTFPGDGQLGDPLGFGLPGHGPALSYTDNLDGTVTDNNTQFVWEKKTGSVGSAVDCTSAAVCPDPHNVNNRYTWTDSGDSDSTNPDGTLFTVYLEQLNNTCDGDPTLSCSSDADCGADAPCGFAGHRDWCIPNVKRLQSIVDYAVTSPSIDTTFGATFSSVYWSSTSSTAGASSLNAWEVSFSNGLTNAFFKTSFFHARAVRTCE